MNTPLFSAVEAYVNKDTARFHVPGHKGALPYLDGLARYDVTEVDGCDELYRPRSAIADTEARFARLYKSDASLLCAGGSTLCIQTMLALAVRPHGRLICGRAAHVAAVNAMALLDIEPRWIFPETDEVTGLAKAVTAAEIRDALKQTPDASAVYITSPDYYGSICDIASISKVCREYGKPLLVDNAHGAHLRFLEPSMHPINLGADMCSDSLHKTLPVLTGGAVLHIKNKKYIADAKRYMSIFGSTSPNYLILMSIDKALDTLSAGFPEKLKETASKIRALEILAEDRGFLVPKGMRDPLRLTLGFGAMGYGPCEFLDLLRENGIEPEMTFENFCVLMASPSNRPEDFAKLTDFIQKLPERPAIPVSFTETVKPESVKSLREAAFAPVADIALADALGRTAGSIVAACPPGIPLVIPGELIDENLTRHLKKYGISRLNVLE